MNVQPGQTPRIAAPIECAPLARLCVEAAYDCGARDVVIDWTDDFVTRQRYLKADEAVFSEFPSYLKARFDWLLEQQAPALSITGSDPEALKGVDPARIQTWQRASAQPTKPYYDAMTANRFQWCVAAYPTRAWAEKVFPDKRGEEAVDALWEAIFSVCRITGDGKGLEIGFNNRFLLEAIKAAPADRIRMELNTPTSPCLILPKTGEPDSFLYMVLPVRLKAGE